MLEVIFNGFDISQIIGNAFYVVLFLIGFDVITGILASAKEKQINSSINFDGLIHKFGIIVALFFVSFVDAYFKTEGTITSLGVGMIIVYECMSIIENFSRIGINLTFITKYFDEDKVGKGK